MGERMRHNLLRLSLLICLTASLTGQTAPWQKYRNVAGNFAVLLPVEPKETTTGDTPATTSHTIQAIAEAVSYTIVYVTLDEEQEVTEANYKTYKEGVLKELSTCTVLDEQPAAPAIPGYIGRWYRMNCDISNTKLTFVGNLYWGKHYAYAVLGMFATAPTDPPSIKKFVNSFGVIDASK